MSESTHQFDNPGQENAAGSLARKIGAVYEKFKKPGTEGRGKQFQTELAYEWAHATNDELMESALEQQPLYPGKPLENWLEDLWQVRNTHRHSIGLPQNPVPEKSFFKELADLEKNS